MFQRQTVSVVLPAYNEAAAIAAVVKDFFSVQNSDGSPVVDEVIVIDNNSSDGTGFLADAAGAKVIREQVQGYGRALTTGLRATSSDLVVMCESDGTFAAQDIAALLSYSLQFDMVSGTRTHRLYIGRGSNMGFWVRSGNIVLARLLQLLFNTCTLSDCGCTFRLLKREALRRVLPDLSVTGSHFLVDLVLSARRHRIRTIEIPVQYRARVGDSKITGSLRGMVSTGLRMLGLMLQRWPGTVS